MSDPLQPKPSFPERKRASVAVIQRDGHFLAIKRSQTVRAPGKICFPGGGVEPGETLEQALIREMQEELGIQVEPLDQIWQSHSVRGFELNWLRAIILEGETVVPNLEEVESFRWMTMQQMVMSPDLLDSNVEFFAALDRNEFSI